MKIEVTPEEIEAVKKEYREEHTVHGTNKPVILNDKTAEYVIISRKRLEMYLNSVHKSHDMTEWGTEIMAPAGTSRFYSYRECNGCGGAQYYSAAGRFIDPELKHLCVESEEYAQREIMKDDYSI